MSVRFKTCWRCVTLLLLSGLVAFEAYAQPQPKDSTVPELKISRVAGKSGPRGWSRFRVGEPALFTANFPHPPQQATNHVFGNDGTSTLWLFFTANDTALYQIIWSVDENASINKAEKEKVREYNNFAHGFVDGLVKSGKVSGGEITAERRVKLHKIEGFERDTSFKDHEARLRMFHLGKARLAIVSVWNSDNPLEERNSFFDSLALEIGNRPPEAIALKSPLAGWKRYQIGNRASIMLPAEPTEEGKPMQFGRSSTIVSYYRLDEPDYYSIAVLSDVSFGSAKITAREREYVFQQIWLRITEKLRTELNRSASPAKLQMTPLRNVMIGTEKTQEREFTIGGLHGRARIVLAAKTLYAVMAFWSLETPLAVRDAFFESLSVDSPRP